MYDVVTLGETLIDCTPAPENEQGMPQFSCNPGGAPANVAAMVAKLGGASAFVGKVGADLFGDFCARRWRPAASIYPCEPGTGRDPESVYIF